MTSEIPLSTERRNQNNPDLLREIDVEIGSKTYTLTVTSNKEVQALSREKFEELRDRVESVFEKVITQMDLRDVTFHLQLPKDNPVDGAPRMYKVCDLTDNTSQLDKVKKESIIVFLKTQPGFDPSLFANAADRNAKDATLEIKQKPPALPPSHVKITPFVMSTADLRVIACKSENNQSPVSHADQLHQMLASLGRINPPISENDSQLMRSYYGGWINDCKDDDKLYWLIYHDVVDYQTEIDEDKKLLKEINAGLNSINNSPDLHSFKKLSAYLRDKMRKVYIDHVKENDHSVGLACFYAQSTSPQNSNKRFIIIFDNDIISNVFAPKEEPLYKHEECMMLYFDKAKKIYHSVQRDSNTFKSIFNNFQERKAAGDF